VNFHALEMITRTFFALASFAAMLLVPGATQAQTDVDQSVRFCPVVRVVGHEAEFTCYIERYDLCHRIPQGFTGVRAAYFINLALNGKNNFSITLYTGDTCNDKWARWSFNKGWMGDYTINDFQRPELWNNVRSFKVAHYQTSTTTGNDLPKDDRVIMARCDTGKE
ncbi:hypothetical protein BGZ50_000805, partial [Haplosporangium sp. Z 11]